MQRTASSRVFERGQNIKRDHAWLYYLPTAPIALWWIFLAACKYRRAVALLEVIDDLNDIGICHDEIENFVRYTRNDHKSRVNRRASIWQSKVLWRPRAIDGVANLVSCRWHGSLPDMMSPTNQRFVLAISIRRGTTVNSVNAKSGTVRQTAKEVSPACANPHL